MAYGQKVFGKIDAHTLLDEYGSPCMYTMKAYCASVAEK